LVVDDESSIRDLLSRHLEEAGYEALHAGDGLHALVILRNTLPKVIISDLQMPRMSGFEFIEIVRRRFPTIPVIALSGSIPSEFPAGTEPDRWFEKRLGTFAELVRAVDELARTAPHDVRLPQVISIPIRTRPGFDGYITLTCTECLRTFRARNGHGTDAAAGIAVCTHCEAPVQFLIENSPAV
jgi:CheY-like chemotaxis protein